MIKADFDVATARTKRFVLGSLALAELLVMSVWFSASALVPQLSDEWSLTGGQQSLLTISVQVGFVIGAFGSALLNLPDRISSFRLISVSAFAAAVCNLGMVLFDSSLSLVLASRFLTGVFLAGVYPPGMKLMASWCKEDRGLWMGILVGALTFGSALPHLINVLPGSGASGMPPWRSVLFATSILSAVGAFVCGAFVRDGPLLSTVVKFDRKHIKHVVTDRPTRLANFGYFGHMWELYAMWTWVPVLLIESYAESDIVLSQARLAGFSVVAVGAVGCIVAGFIADRIGRTIVTISSLTVSGLCCLFAGSLFSYPVILTIVALVWGFAVVADSAQFSTAVSELSDPRYIGTALTMQTSLGFLLTMVSIRGVPYLFELLGWEFALVPLALGPIAGIISMFRLRELPEAVKMASGNR